MSSDPLAPLLELPGVRDASESARDALSAVHRHRANLRGWDKTSREASWRAGRSSATIDGGSVELQRDAQFDDPITEGAIRVAQALDIDGIDQFASVFRRAPGQALARLHMLAAAGLVDGDLLGRPRDEPHIAHRLDLLGQLITGGTSVPAPVLAAIVHGELLSVAPFHEGNGVVARGASRLVSAATGLDPHLLGVPEVTWLRRLGEYRERSAAFATGDPGAVAAWIVLCCEAMEAGAAEAKSIADAAP
ncbi:oxidoreductase [Gordonia zhaorongruii]|uniref:oxidoreductase n=1 Tax=Gordonia zhaorongruii TaxID=2597659 RepID=UPI001046B82F|nr:oxidoreductase [Gordonia zhaorongruii]